MQHVRDKRQKVEAQGCFESVNERANAYVTWLARTSPRRCRCDFSDLDLLRDGFVEVASELGVASLTVLLRRRGSRRLGELLAEA